MNEKQFEEYYKKYYSQVYGYIFKRTLNVHVAEDLAMDVFTICYQKRETFDEKKASFGTWVYVITNNKLKNYYRDKKQDVEIDENTIKIAQQDDDILQAYHMSELRKNIYLALNELNETQKKIVVLRYFKDKSSTEIGEIMGMSSVNVRVQLSRCMPKLEKIFEKYNIDGEI